MNKQVRSSMLKRQLKVLLIALCGVLPLALLVLSSGGSAAPLAPAAWANPDSVPAGQSTIGDLVWYDADLNAMRNGGEPGIDGVLVKLFLDDDDGVFDPDVDSLEALTLTGDDRGTPEIEQGWYEFQIALTDAFYWVVIDPSNFDPGGVLAGHVLTSNVIGLNPFLLFLPPGIQTFRDADFGYARAGITIVKRAGDAPDGAPFILPPGGGTVSYSYTVTNTGDLPLFSIVVTDDNGTAAIASDDVTVCQLAGSLNPGTIHSCAWSTFVAGPRTNVAVVTGIAQDANGDPLPDLVTDTDDAEVRLADSPTLTPTPTASVVPTSTPSPSPSLTLTPGASPTPSSTPTITPSPTVTDVPTSTSTPSSTNTPTQTWTPSPTLTPTATRTSSPTATPTTCGPDPYEPDNLPAQAHPLIAGAPAVQHSFHTADDADWFSLILQANRSYRVRTFALTAGTTTIVELYDSSGSQLLATFPGSPAAEASFRVSVGGVYLVKVRESQGQADCRAYSVLAEQLDIYIPIIVVPAPTSTPTHTPTPVPSPTATSTPTPMPGLAHPKAAVVHPLTHRVYVTSRNANRVTMLDGESLVELGFATVGAQPWGIDLYAATNKLYVANFASGDVYVLDAATLAVVKVIHVGYYPTFVKVNELTGKVFVVVYGSNQLAVIDALTDTLQTSVHTGGGGAWGLAVNPNLNRIYVTNRDSGTITTLDGNQDFRVIGALTACNGAAPSPYGLAFNAVNDRLYLACSSNRNVDTARVFRAAAGGLTLFASVPIGNGGEDGGGGVAVNTTTGHAFFTNSRDNTVSVLGPANSIIATWGTGLDPFGVAVDHTTDRVYSINRGGNSITVYTDNP